MKTSPDSAPFCYELKNYSKKYGLLKKNKQPHENAVRTGKCALGNNDAIRFPVNLKIPSVSKKKKKVDDCLKMYFLNTLLASWET